MPEGWPAAHPLIGSAEISSLSLPKIAEKSKEGTCWAVYQRVVLDRSAGQLMLQAFGPEHSYKTTPPTPHWSMAFVGILDLTTQRIVVPGTATSYPLTIRQDIAAVNVRTGEPLALDPDAEYLVVRHSTETYRISDREKIKGWAAALDRQRQRRTEESQHCKIRIYTADAKPVHVEPR